MLSFVLSLMKQKRDPDSQRQVAEASAKDDICINA